MKENFIKLNMRISEQEIEKVLSKLENHKSPGVDQIPAELYKYGGDSVVANLCMLFNFCFEHSTIPNQWQIGEIIPIFKTGDPTNPANYRGITLLTTISKIYGKVLANRILAFSEENFRLNNDNKEGFGLHGSQNGFRP
jgi:hypothetical protein